MTYLYITLHIQLYIGTTLCFILVMALIVSAVGMLVGSLLLLALQNNQSTLALYQANSTVIIGNSSISLQVVQESNYPGDFEHEIEVYEVTLECNKLPVMEKDYVEDSLDSINGSTIYALAGSFITLKVCGSTNLTRIPGRLEVLLVEGLESLASTATILEDFYNFSFFYPGIGGDWLCKEETLKIEEYGYYTLVFLPQPAVAIFNCTAKYHLRILDVGLLPIRANQTLLKNLDEWRLTAVPRPPFTRTCIIASIKDNPDYPSLNTHIRVSYHSYSAYRDGAYLAIVAFVVILPLAVSVCVLVPICRSLSARFKKTVKFDDTIELI